MEDKERKKLWGLDGLDNMGGHEAPHLGRVPTHPCPNMDAEEERQEARGPCSGCAQDWKRICAQNSPIQMNDRRHVCESVETRNDKCLAVGPAGFMKPRALSRVSLPEKPEAMQPQAGIGST